MTGARRSFRNIGANEDGIVSDNLNILPADSDVVVFSKKPEAAWLAPDYDSAQPAVTGVDFNV